MKYEKNKQALEKRMDYQFYLAQKIFRENRKKEPCWLTYHNLGVFYLYEGLFTRTNKNYKVDYLAYYNLMQALHFQQSELTLCALGTYLYWKKRYSAASTYFIKAYEMNPYNMEACYNGALCFYNSCQYKEAVQCITSMLDYLNFEVNWNQVWILLAYAMLYYNRYQYKTEIHKIVQNHLQEIEMCCFQLEYLIDNVLEAQKYLKQAQDDTYGDIYESALFIDYYIKIGAKKGAQVILDQCVEDVTHMEKRYKRLEIKKINKIFDDEKKRKSYILTYKKSFMPVKQWLYAER